MPKSTFRILKVGHSRIRNNLIHTARMAGPVKELLQLLQAPEEKKEDQE